MGTIPASENEYPQVLFAEGAAPSTPATGIVTAYAKSDGLLYWKDDAGTEYAVASGFPDAVDVPFDPTGLGVITDTDVQGALEELDAAVGGGGIPATILDAKGDLIAASAADTAAKLTAGTNDYTLVAASGEAVGLKWVPVRPVFKRTFLLGNTNKSTASTSLTAVDGTNLAYLTLDLAVGDVVRCTLSCQVRLSTSSSVVTFDFEVDQPTSSNVMVAAGADYGSGARTIDTNRHHVTIVGLFTATEAGTHGFRPVWKIDAQTVTMGNATSGADDVAISFIVEKLGAPA